MFCTLGQKKQYPACFLISVHYCILHEQYQELKRFKVSCKERGLYETYDSQSQFKEKLYQILLLILQQ